MLLTAVLGLAIGLGLGALMVRGTFCFNAGLRRGVFDRDGSVLRLFALAIGVQLVMLPAVDALGVTLSPLPLVPVAQVTGGLVFGAGMALAGGCITGLLWKTGAGSLATAIALIGFVLGELTARGVGESLLVALDDASRPAPQTLHAALGVPYAVSAIALGALVLAGLLARSRQGALLGGGIGVLGVAAWVAAKATGYGYGLGFAGTAESVRAALAAGRPGQVSLPLFVAAGIVLAAAATRGPLRRPDGARAARALAGGALMGAGASVAHGCNIGHVLAGLPLLSLASMLASVSMAAGALLTWRLLLASRPRLRGAERPEPVGW